MRALWGAAVVLCIVGCGSETTNIYQQAPGATATAASSASSSSNSAAATASSAVSTGSGAGGAGAGGSSPEAASSSAAGGGGTAPCAPKGVDQCPSDACGYVDDGCGGKVLCSVCGKCSWVADWGPDETDKRCPKDRSWPAVTHNVGCGLSMPPDGCEPVISEPNAQGGFTYYCCP